MSTVLSTWCACAPGLERLVAQEFASFGLKPKELEPGGFTAAMTIPQLYAANLRSALANRITVRIGRFHASEFWELEKRAERIAWHAWIPKGGSIGFRVTSRKSKLYHNDAIAERLGALVSAKVPGVSVAASAAEDEDAHDPRLAGRDQLILVRLVNDEVTISVDSSGDLLYKRGWRQATAKAPLRETLAAAMLAASGWDGTTTLHDPFCGAGTIVIEAARQLRRIPAGRDRSFAFERWPTFAPQVWADVRREADQGIRPVPKVTILGSDRDAGAIRAAEANARRAGVEDLVTFAEADIRDLPPAPRTTLVTNPPYGVRVGDRAEMAPLYAALGRLTRADGTRLTFLAPEPTLARATRVSTGVSWATTNGGIPVECHTSIIEAGPSRSSP